ncbi:MAG: Uma2 family endonuclease [Desulfobacteraceae bacterium]|nr:Uma2 family endonuclease [Desulfobacteraceae bacterium]
MSLTQRAVSFISEEEYLETERESETKHEYFQGEIFAMAGASKAHNLIVTNVIREISTQLKKTPCRVYPSDLRVKIADTGLYTYPDVTVVCGEERFSDDRSDTLLNPKVIIEVLSDSTEKYDRGTKFEHYRKLESLKEYVLISQNRLKIEKFFKNETGFWVLTESDENNPIIILESVNCTLELSEVYDKVENIYR